ncbi:acyltransferase family protein [Frankia sp. CcWB2]
MRTTDGAVTDGTVTVPLRRPHPGLVRIEERLGFRPDIEGLRALAVLPVLCYHGQVPHAAGGFIGVDVFFVVSGFLITSLLVREAEVTGRISLAGFYARRARRILPAACVVLVFVTVASWLTMPPLRQAETVHDVAAASVYLVNWRFISNQTDYLASGRDPSPVLHFWSLSVEEQFYLVWPLLLLLVVLFARRATMSLAAVAVPVTLGLVALSLALSLHWTLVETPVAYLGSPARAWQFGVGALLAFAAPALARLDRGRTVIGVRIVLGWAGCVAVVAAVVSYDSVTVYPGTAALLPTFGAAAVIAAGTGVHPGHRSLRAGAGRLLGTRVLTVIGSRSYSLYLWHWAVLVLVEARVGDLSWQARTAAVAACAVPAELSVRLVERPVRLSAVAASGWRRGLAIAVTATLLPAATGMLVGTDALQRMRGGGRDTVAVLPHLPAATVVRDPFDQPGGLLSGPVTPAPWSAYDDLPRLPDGCMVSPRQTTSPPCQLNTDGATGRVVLLGDSHAAQWFGAVYHMARGSDWSVEVLTKVGCPLPAISVRSEQLGREFTECDTWRENTFRRLAAEPKPDVIFLSTYNRYTGDEEKVVAGWRNTIARLASLGAPLVYIVDTPHPPEDIPACISGAIDNWRSCSFPRDSGLPRDPLLQAVVEGREPAVSAVDLNVILCPGTGPCPAVRGSVLLYRDDSHITNTAAVMLGPALEHALVTKVQLPSRGPLLQSSQTAGTSRS